MSALGRASARIGAMDNPVLILVRGVPGSGKSYLTLALRQSLGADKVVVLDPDATDYASQAYHDHTAALTAEGVDEKFHPYRFLRAQAYQGITANKIIIWNQAWTNLDGFNKTILNLQTYASEHGTQLPVLVVEMTVDEAIAKTRVAQRAGQGGHDVSAEAFGRFLRDYTSFADAGHKTVALHGEDDIAVSVAAVEQALADL